MIVDDIECIDRNVLNQVRVHCIAKIYYWYRTIFIIFLCRHNNIPFVSVIMNNGFPYFWAFLALIQFLLHSNIQLYKVFNKFWMPRRSVGIACYKCMPLFVELWQIKEWLDMPFPLPIFQCLHKNGIILLLLVELGFSIKRSCNWLCDENRNFFSYYNLILCLFWRIWVSIHILYDCAQHDTRYIFEYPHLSCLHTTIHFYSDTLNILINNHIYIHTAIWVWFMN